jgi:hypothetical protein
MGYELAGFINVDVQDWEDDIEIITDVDGLIDIMQSNRITPAELLEKINGVTSYDAVSRWVDEEADHLQLQSLSADIINRMRFDYGRACQMEQIRLEREELRSRQS